MSKNPSSKQLAMRDPAMAALLGVHAGSDFGAESDFGIDFGSDFGYTPNFGDDAAPPATNIPAPANAQQMMAVWNAHHAKAQHTQRRASILEPNAGSDVKVERYSFSLSQALVLGTGLALSMTGSPDTNLRPQRLTMNAPAPGFCTITEVKVGNTSVTSGTSDAWENGATAVGQSYDMPTLTPSNKATIIGNYTGYVPPGFVAGSAYLFVSTFKGPATVIA